MSNRAALAAFAAMVTACAIDERTSTTDQPINTCAQWLCGGNSPIMDSYGMTDLSLTGLPNAAGLVLQGFYKNGNKFTASVTNGKLSASRWYYANPLWVRQVLSGSGLVNGYFLITTNDGSGKSFAITVDQIGSVQSWAQPNPAPSTPVVLESYVLHYTWVSGWLGAFAPPPRNVCSNPPVPPHTASYTFDTETLGQDEASTLLFEGDRIDAGTKQDTAVDNTWFNFGCAGHTLAKLALTGHTQAAQNAGTFTTTLAERTTMLKMLTADYCGDGTPFTVTGQPLRWRDNHGTMFYNAPALGLTSISTTNAKLESRWNEYGPVCLHVPRVDENPTTLAKQTYGDPPNIYDQIVQYCPQKLPPECVDQSFAVDGFHLVSVTPSYAAQPAP